MSSLSLNPSPLLLLSLLLLVATTPATTSTIGFTYTPTPSGAPSPSHVASTLNSLRVSSLRLPNPTPELIRAFSYSNISLLLSLPNSLVPFLAHNRSNANLFLSTHVLPFHPRSRISTISVGHDPLLDPADLSALLLPAIQNLHLALHRLGITDISVSTTFSFLHVLTTAFPPSSAEFHRPLLDVLIKPLLDFLKQTNSSFLVNLRPYEVYKAKHEIPIGFALFRQGPFGFRDDPVTGVRYRNLFDEMVDAVVAAMAVAGHEGIPVVVAETGWPSGQVPGVNADPDATEFFAGLYVNGLVEHLRSGLGTPLRKEGVAQAYVYELFDSDGLGQENGTEPVPLYGIFFANMTKKVDVDFSAALGGMGGDGGRLTLRVLMAVAVLCWVRGVHVHPCFLIGMCLPLLWGGFLFR